MENFCSPDNVCGHRNIFMTDMFPDGGGPPPPPVIEPEYQAILDYADGEGYTLPSAPVQVKQNQLVKDLKAAGVWALLDLFYCFRTDGDISFAMINWVDPNNYECTPGSSVTFIPNDGVKGDGTDPSGRINTNYSFMGGVKFTRDNASFGGDILEVENPGTLYYIMGDDNPDGSNSIFQYFTSSSGGTTQAIINDDTGFSTATTNADNVGLWLIQRPNANTAKMFRNALELASANIASNPFQQSQFVLLGALNFYSPVKLSMVFAGASLVGKELAFYNAWQTYKA